jgi:phosphate-selective porin OprO/OprP
MDQLTSSNTITFLERAQPVKAFAPGNKAGVQLSLAGEDREIAWAFGGFTDTQRDHASDDSDGPARLIGRVVWVPRALADPTRGRLVHLGFAGQYVHSTDADVRYKASAESFFAPALVDTGSIDASNAGVHGLELAIQDGPFLLQSEYLGAVVAPRRHDPALFYGGYLQLSALLTGEVRPYDRRRGAFGMPVPMVPFSLRDRVWRGAWEVGLRYSYLDLDAGGVAGGRDHALSVGVNWYWNRHVRLMADYGFTSIIGDKPDGTLHIFQTRLQLVY